MVRPHAPERLRHPLVGCLVVVVLALALDLVVVWVVVEVVRWLW